jgi:hypothetical protein
VRSSCCGCGSSARGSASLRQLCVQNVRSQRCVRDSKGGIHLTVLREKPHFSAPGEPFMNSMIGAWLISLPSLVFRSSAGCAAVAGANAVVGAGAAGTAADEGPGAAAPPPALRAITCDVISGAFAPTTPPTFSPPCAGRVRGNIVSGVGLLTLLLKLSLFQCCSDRSSNWPRVGCWSVLLLPSFLLSSSWASRRFTLMKTKRVHRLDSKP